MYHPTLFYYKMSTVVLSRDILFISLSLSPFIPFHPRPRNRFDLSRITVGFNFHRFWNRNQQRDRKGLSQADKLNKWNELEKVLERDFQHRNNNWSTSGRNYGGHCPLGESDTDSWDWVFGPFPLLLLLLLLLLPRRFGMMELRK